MGRNRTIWIVVPGQAFDRGKTRLSPVLDAAARRAFSRDCFAHVVRTARGVAGPGRVLVVSRAAEVLGLARRQGVQALRETGRGLNTAVTQATRFAAQHGAGGVLVVHGDLPGVTMSELARLAFALAKYPGVVIAPDEGLAGDGPREREGIAASREAGTNALGVCPAGRIRFRFGAGSFEKHRSEARQARLRLQILRSPGLAQDVDTPDNYRRFGRRNNGKET